jgi:N-acetylated-alpha-linked acidic dipeptidase
MEKHAEELNRKLVAYLNADSSGKGAFSPSGSHTLERFVEEIVRDVKDPVSGKSLLETRNNPALEFHINPLGSGSDYTPFLQHLGIASLDLRFASEDGGVYHSIYDDYAWYARFGDPGFLYGQALSQVHVTAVMRLADAPLLPFEFGRLSATVERYLDEIGKLADPAESLDLAGVRAAVARLRQASSGLESSWGRAMPKLNAASSARLSAIDEELYRTERMLTSDPGLPGRPWYRHRLYAPGRYTGYDAKTLPGIREAVESKNADEARQEAATLAQLLRALAGKLDQIEGQIQGLI